jgi:hypothetical protein
MAAAIDADQLYKALGQARANSGGSGRKNNPKTPKLPALNDLPWWAGFLLLGAGLAVPETRQALGQLVKLAWHAFLWGIAVTMVISTILLVIAVVSGAGIGEAILDWLTWVFYGG